MTPITQNLPDQVKGDTFNGAQFTLVVNDIPPTSNIDLVEIDFRKTINGTAALSLTSSESDGGISITDAVNGVFQIDEIESVSLEAGIYHFDIEITFADGSIKTYVKGTWTILQDVTR